MSSLENYTVTHNEGIYYVQRKQSDAPPRVFENRNCRCKCMERVAYLGTCVHELAIRKHTQQDMFYINMFHRRHEQRKALTVSHEEQKDSTVSPSLQENSTFTVEDVDDDGPIDALDKDEASIHFDETLVQPKRQNITFNVLKTACIDCVNACLRWKNQNVSKTFLGMISHTLEVLINPQAEDAKWLGENIENYVNSFTQSCGADLKKKPVISDGKRKLSQSDVFMKRKKPKSCSKCGEAYETGHHSAATCKNI